MALNKVYFKKSDCTIVTFILVMFLWPNLHEGNCDFLTDIKVDIYKFG